jgi:hypothetical protein
MPAMYETNLVGKRQEILDKVFNVESDKTPFLSSLKAGKTPVQSVATWLAEVYPAVASTGVLDGTAATTPNRVDRLLLTGIVQQFRQEWGVTQRAQLTETAGVRDEAARQMMAAMVLLKRQIEQQFLSVDDSAEESGQTPFTTRGVLKWLTNAAQTNHIVPAALRPAAASAYTGAVASFEDTAFRALMDAAYAARKAPVDLDAFVGVELKKAIDALTNIYPSATTSAQVRTVYNVNDPSTYQNKVDFLRCSTGNVRVHLDPFIAITSSTGAASAYTPKSGVFVDLAMWDIGWMAKPANTNLADDGSGKKGFIDAFALLRCLNPLGQAYAYSNS